MNSQRQQEIQAANRRDTIELATCLAWNLGLIAVMTLVFALGTMFFAA